MQCPKCAAVQQPGALACAYCGATLASGENLGDAARALDARFDALAAEAARLLASQQVPPLDARNAPAVLARGGDNAARVRDVLDATARAIPRPASPQEALVWLRRAPALAWVTYRAPLYARTIPVGHLPEVIAELYRDRASWESRDKALAAAFAQAERPAREAAPTLAQGARRFALANPLLAAVIALVAAVALASFVGGSSHHRHRSHRSRRHSEAPRYVTPAPPALGVS